MHRVATLLLTLVIAPAGQSVPTADPAPRALAMQYQDGRTITRLLRPTGSMWTPGVQRIPGAETSRDGQPLAALHLAHVVDRQDVTVTVSLVYGRPTNTPVPVTTVRVVPEKPTRVDELRAFGVEPVTLSIVAVAANLPYPPAVISPTSMLDVRLEPLESNVPAYRFVITNGSTYALMTLRFQGFRGERAVISALRRGERNYPLVEAGREYAFILDPQVVATIGKTHHANVKFNGNEDSRVPGHAHDPGAERPVGSFLSTLIASSL